MPPDKCNSITAKATGLTFHRSTLLWPDRCLLAYGSTDLPVSSFVSHSSLLTAKSVDLAMHVMVSLCNGNRPYLS